MTARARRTSPAPQQAPAPTGRESYGLLAGSRAKGYYAGTVCPVCLTTVTFVGKFIPKEQSTVGEHIALTSKVDEFRCEGQLSGKAVKWHCPRCDKQRGLGVDWGETGEAVAIFVLKAPTP